MAKMMDALVKPERAPGLVLTQVPVPTPGPGEVLIKIRKTAICGTDAVSYTHLDVYKRQVLEYFAENL